MTDHIQFSPQILQRLGEELVTNIDQGILELARNSYDADASVCRVELSRADEAGGVLTVVDDGIGMDLDAIRTGWLVLGRSPKNRRTLTALGRTPVGDKGLGRLAALRLGTEAVLTTRPAKEPGVQYRLALRWLEFDRSDTVEAVPIQIDTQDASGPPGTSIEVSGLRVRLGRREVQRLARALLLLADPFDDMAGFHPQLVAPAFVDLERLVKDAYFDDAELKLVAELDAAGHATARVVDWKGATIYEGAHANLTKAGQYEAPPATFELWVFLLDSEAFAARTSTLREVRSWLEVVGGVHLYHRSLRVHPYGDPGHDWLQMNLARARSPELRPSTNTSVGRVRVTDPEDRLLQKTDRSGFIENEAFGELRRFATDALDWMSKERLRARETKRQTTRPQSGRAVKTARAHLSQAVSALPPETRAAVSNAVDRLEKARDREVNVLREEVQLYRTLATVGTTAGVLGHESAKPLIQIDQMARRIESRGREALGPAYDQSLGKPIELIDASVDALRSFAQFSRQLLQRDKRRVGRVRVHATIENTIDLFMPFLKASRIRVEGVLAGDIDPEILGSEAALESIITNLVTNAIHAFDKAAARTTDRRIVVRTEVAGTRLLLRILDNGPGVIDIEPDEIWLPGRTTVPGGTGLGLTIVRDAATDLSGKCTVIPEGELGGAEFIVELPLA